MKPDPPSGVAIAYAPTASDSNAIWSQYLQGQFRLMLFVGVMTGRVAVAIGLPGTLAFAVLAGLLDIVMSVGPLVVTIIGAIVAFVAGSNYLPISNLWFAVLVAAVEVVVRSLFPHLVRQLLLCDVLDLEAGDAFCLVEV